MPGDAHPRRRFLKRAASGVAALPWLRGARAQTAPAVQSPPVPPAPESGPPIFDPMLDPRCRALPAPPADEWHARWIWYPGQLAAHLHRNGVHASMIRCTNVGYPSNYRQPLSKASFRRRTLLAAETTIRWRGPLGRIRMLVNGREGDVTSRTARLPAGDVELLVRVDFAESLPCLLLEGGPFSTGEDWETSLDEKMWVAAECEPASNDAGRLPDSEREVLVAIPPYRIVSSRGLRAEADGHNLEPGGEMLVDFRHDELGFLTLRLSGEGKLQVTVGESETEAADADPAHFEQYALPVITATPEPRTVRLPERCLRYARLQSDRACHVSELHFEAKVTPVEYRAAFACDDPIVNALWSAGAATVHACLHGVYVDGIRRDALSWADGTISLEAADLLFGDVGAAHQSLLVQTLPADPTRADLGILDSPLYLLWGFENDFMARGDLRFSTRYRDRLVDVLELFVELADERGFVDGRRVEPYGFFPDWSATPETGPDAHGTPAYAQMLAMHAFRTGARFCERWGDASRARRYAQVAARLRESILSHFWDEAEGVFVNGYDREGRRDGRASSYAQVFGILFDLVPEPKWPALFEKVLDNPRRRAGNLSIFRFHEVVAYAKAGRTQAALAVLREDWGGLLARGLTRFPEDIRPAETPVEQLAMYGRPYANSLCHEWAGATPVILLARGVLGVWPRGPGYSECLVRPQLADLAWARGRIPTPPGPIDLELARDRPGRLSLPSGVSVELSGYAGRDGQTRFKGPVSVALERA